MQLPYIKNENYQLGLPVFHVGSYIKKKKDSNGQIKDRLISIVFKNISEIQIEAIEGVIHSFNSFNEALSIDSFSQIEIPNFTPGSLYGDLLFFNSNKDAVSFKVEIKRIKYFNQDIQIYNENSFYNFVEEDIVKNMDLKQFILKRLDSNIEYINDLYQDEYLYRCVCGSINLKSNRNCYHCKISKDTFEKLFTDEKMNLILNEEAQSFLNDRLFVKYNYFDLNENEISEFLSKSNTKNLVKEIKSIQKKYDILSPVIKNKINDEINIKESGDALINKIETLQKKIELEKIFLENKRKQIKEEKESQEVYDLSVLLNTTRYEIFENINKFEHILKKSSIEIYLKLFEESNEDKIEDYLNFLSNKISNFNKELNSNFHNKPELSFNNEFNLLYKDLKLFNKNNKKILSIIEDKNPNLKFKSITNQLFELKKTIENDLKKVNNMNEYYTQYKSRWFEWFEESPKIFSRNDLEIIKEINKIERIFNFIYYENEFKKIFSKYNVLYVMYSSLIFLVNILLWPLIIIIIAIIIGSLTGEI